MDVIRQLGWEPQAQNLLQSIPVAPGVTSKGRAVGVPRPMQYNQFGEKKGGSNKPGTWGGKPQGTDVGSTPESAIREQEPRRPDLSPPGPGTKAQTGGVPTGRQWSLGGQGVQVSQSRVCWPGVAHGLPWLESSLLWVCPGKEVPLNVLTKSSF